MGGVIVSRLKHVELMAFTELKDKNNVEFFESDIGWDDHEKFMENLFCGRKFLYEWEA